MAFIKNFLLVLLVCSTITLCLAKPKWAWAINDDEAELETLGAHGVEMGAFQDNVKRRFEKTPCIYADSRRCKYP